MAVASMTGFARSEGQVDDVGWTWELRSVNARGLDIRCRLPTGTEGLDAGVRTAVAERFRRGSITVNLSLAVESAAHDVAINRALIDRLLALKEELGDKVDPAPPRFEALIAVRGVIETAEPDGIVDVEARDAALTAGFRQALEALAVARAEEGERLAAVLRAHLDEIGRLAGLAAEAAAARPDAVRQRIERQVRELIDGGAPLSEERLAQELALVMAKADIREELDRLSSHIEAGQALIAGGGAIGRRFDFLCQELNREANTLCAKSGDVELTRLGLGLKSAIEQLREQVQNVE